jgi:hypothetical protein
MELDGWATDDKGLNHPPDWLFAGLRSDELEGTGVSIFSIDPGQVDTDMHEFLARSPGWLRRRGTHRPSFTPVERTADLMARLAAGHGDALSGRCISASRDQLDDLIARTREICDDNLYMLSFKR